MESRRRSNLQVRDCFAPLAKTSHTGSKCLSQLPSVSSLPKLILKPRPDFGTGADGNGKGTMNSKPLGKSGETIPEIGLGTSRYRGGVEPLHEGISLGAFIDTAEMYRTEDVVGMAVQGSRESTFIATKVLSRNLKYSDLM